MVSLSSHQKEKLKFQGSRLEYQIINKMRRSLLSFETKIYINI